jgi:hypothetical protein
VVMGCPNIDFWLTFSDAYLLYRQMRASMYLISAFAQDEETQRKGCVGIFMNMKPFRRPVDPADDSKNIYHFMGNLAPIRYVGYHFCNDEDPRKNMISSVKPTEPPSAHQPATFLRLRFHSGTSTTKELDLGFTWFASISILTFSSVLFCRFITGRPL